MQKAEMKGTKLIFVQNERGCYYIKKNEIFSFVDSMEPNFYFSALENELSFVSIQKLLKNDCYNDTDTDSFKSFCQRNLDAGSKLVAIRSNCKVNLRFHYSTLKRSAGVLIVIRFIQNPFE